ncbi:hypothetical protein [Thermodesulforhabdus norvegica]|uniref:Uncharacterized protein n=1 Tax=Thermodesulforhabdus norvegica TaxID=39841 RepID=A0A1I4TGG5_9BACT|nr:hypothetical protein [Thermodesulforhabdus norvegica]SFM75888.1 hypothetical protein SAMN05660836_01405 [Thermodesulforhabdus norvegica]
MIFRFGRRRERSKRAKDRLESCINTILDLNERLGEGKISPDIIQHFKRLKQTFSDLDDAMVDEKEVNRIEDATNKLLQEIRALYGESFLKKLYDMPKH